MTDIAAAYHEAAHCVVARRLGLMLRKASIEHDGSGTTTTLVLRADADNPVWAELQIIVAMAGSAAEVVLLERDDIPDAADRAEQERHAKNLAPARNRDWQNRCWKAACAYVNQFAADIEALADELLIERQLTGFALTRTIERAENQERRN